MNERNFNSGPAGSLATAQDLALSNNPVSLDETPLTTRFLASLNDSTKRMPPEAKPIDITEGITLDGLTLLSDPPIVSDEERKQAVALQAKHDFLESQEASFSPANSELTFRKQRDSAYDAAKAGNDVSTVKVSSKDEIEGQFLHRRLALRAALVELTHEQTVPLCKVIFARLQRHLAESLVITEEQDRACATGLGLKYEPSLVWKATATAIQRYTFAARKPHGPHSVSSPRRILDGIISL
jgi:hypothetical protein